MIKLKERVIQIFWIKITLYGYFTANQMTQVWTDFHKKITQENFDAYADQLSLLDEILI